jgi:hypothetical protein
MALVINPFGMAGAAKSVLLILKVLAIVNWFK